MPVERFDPTWPWTFKWAYDGYRNKAHVWRIPEGTDGRGTHRQEAEKLFGRPVKITQKDALGLATHIPAEKHIDGRLIAPPHVIVEAFYGTEIPNKVHEALSKQFPDAVVRNARLSSVAEPVAPKKRKKETDEFEEPKKEIDDPELRSDFSTDPKYHLKDPGRYTAAAVWAAVAFQEPERSTTSDWRSRFLGWLRKDSATGADHEGAMVCLYVPEAVGEQIKVKGGEPVSDMHITLAYFMDKAADRDDWDKLAEIIEQLAKKHGKLSGTVGGYGIFHNDVDVLWASADVPGINPLQHEVVEAAEDAGFMVSKDHSFTPHITLKYDHSGKLPKREPIEIEFAQLCLTTGGERQCFDFTGEGFNKNFSSALYY